MVPRKREKVAKWSATRPYQAKNRHHVAEKSLFYPVVSVRHRFLSGQAQSFRLCLGMRIYRKDQLWQQVLEVTRLTVEAVR